MKRCKKIKNSPPLWKFTIYQLLKSDDKIESSNKTNGRFKREFLGDFTGKISDFLDSK